MFVQPPNYLLVWTFASARAPPFIGVDISKATLDWAVFDGKSIVFKRQSPNSESGIKAIVKLISHLPGFTITGSICCMEHTGIYNALAYLHKLAFPIWLENSLQIKRSGGIQRGKNDAIDAAPIAKYSFRFRDRMRLWGPPRPVIQKLAYPSALRQRLLVARQQLQQPIAELQGFVAKAVSQQMSKLCQSSLKGINSDRRAAPLESANKQINDFIKQDEHLRELFGLIVSVPGVGCATATELLVATPRGAPQRVQGHLRSPKTSLPCRSCSLRTSIRYQRQRKD